MSPVAVGKGAKLAAFHYCLYLVLNRLETLGTIIWPGRNAVGKRRSFDWIGRQG